MRSDPANPDTYDRCRTTHRLRLRARAAEAEIDVARAETNAVYTEMRALRATIRDERAALTSFLESPEWQRDLLIMARELVRTELLTLSLARKGCGTCGSFGRGFYENLLRPQIDALTTEHRLVPEQGIDPIDWPVRMGSHTRKGRALRDDWLRTPAPRRRAAQDRTW